MTTHHTAFDLTLTAHHATRFPGIFGDTAAELRGARIALTGDDHAIAEWVEVDVDGALLDFESRESFDIGPAWHIDVCSPGDDISLLVWHRSKQRPSHVLTVTATNYYARIRHARDEVERATRNRYWDRH